MFCLLAFILLIIVSEASLSNCSWSWSFWSSCSSPCNSGKTTRFPRCICEGFLANDSKCYILSRKNNETVPCNEHPCGSIKAHNKAYWLSQHEAYFRAKLESGGKEIWPLPNPRFNCSLGENLNHSKSNRHLTDVLHEKINDFTYNLEWTLLAKEYAALLLNLFNGYRPSSEGISIIRKAQKLIENCVGFSQDEMILVGSIKDGLMRINNNIGLDNIQGENTEQEENDLSMKLFAILGISTFAIVLIALVVGCYLGQRRKKFIEETVEGEMYDTEESTSQEDLLVPATPTQLSLPGNKRKSVDDTSSTGDDSM